MVDTCEQKDICWALFPVSRRTLGVDTCEQKDICWALFPCLLYTSDAADE